MTSLHDNGKETKTPSIICLSPCCPPVCSLSMHTYPYILLLHRLVLVFVNVTQARVIWEEELQLRKTSPSYGPTTSLWGIFLFSDQSGRAQATVVGAIPGQVVLSCIRKQTQQVVMSKSVHSTLPWPLPQSRLKIPALSSLSNGPWLRHLLRVPQRPMLGLPVTEIASENFSHRSRKKSTSLLPTGAATLNSAAKGSFWLDSQQTEGSREEVWINSLKSLPLCKTF